MSELRKDPLCERWVIISTERGRRPMDFKVEKAERKKVFVLSIQEMKTMSHQKYMQ